MSRTKNKSRKGQGKRPREESISENPPSKKQKQSMGPPPRAPATNSDPQEPVPQTITKETELSSKTANPHSPTPESQTLPPDLESLKPTHEITTISIISSSQIQKKVTRALSILSSPSIGAADKKPSLVVFHSKGKDASKMISVVEIVKREIGKREGGRWFQYCWVGSLLSEKMEKKGKKEKGKGKEGEEGEGEEEGSKEEEGFEVMKTPFERVIEGQAKVRSVPVMSIFLARERVESLLAKYGEQTNEVSKA